MKRYISDKFLLLSEFIVKDYVFIDLEINEVCFLVLVLILKKLFFLMVIYSDVK